MSIFQRRVNHPHYGVVENVRHSSIKKAVRETYNLELLEYPAGEHAQVTDGLGDLLEDVEEYRKIH